MLSAQLPSRLPTLFVPHGAPTFALRPGMAGAAIHRFAQQLPSPRAIIMVSAHWDTDVPVVGTATRLETIHDFWGFPEALYDLRYPASGCPEAAQMVVQALERVGLPVEQDARRGLDHGAWVPLRLMFPEADVPVIPLSLQSRGGPAQALRLGRALAPLADQGFLVVGSGSLTHNLRDFQLANLQGGATPAYVRDFADWMGARLMAGDTPSLLDYREQAPEARRAHPADEHLLPLFVAYGAGFSGEMAPQVERIYAGIDDHVIAMDAFAFS